MANASEVAVQKQQKQKPVGEDLPSDPAERKRVLNVLAQRRYRRRRKEQQVQLEGFIHALNGSNAPNSPRGASASNSNGYAKSDFILDSISGSESADNSSYRESRSSTRSQSEGDSFSPLSSQVDSAMSDIDLDSLLNLPSESSIPDTSSHANFTPDFQTDPSWPLGFEPDSNDLAVQLSSFLQTDDIQNSTFADDYLVSVPELDLLRAARSIAMRLNSGERIFDVNANSIFFESPTAFDWSLLPLNLQPTVTQLTLPHHPVLDLLPWPKVRTKLITMFNTPQEAWPKHPQDQSVMTPFRLVCDMEDGGIRVYGDDPTNECAWEIQQSLVDAWWWAMDHGVICLSNQRKKAKGDEPLKMGLLT